jgi:hypothetical protein
MSDRADTTKSGEGRRAGWVSARLRTDFTCRYGNGTGVIRSISASGVVIEQAEPRLVVGDEVRLRFSLLEDTLPIEIRANVTEGTETGFEAEFHGLSVRTRKLLRMAISKALSRADENDDPDDTPTLLSLGR